MSWVAPSSPTTGMTPFGLTGPIVAHNRVSQRTRKVPKRGRRNPREGRMDKIDEKLNILRKSFSEIAASPEEGRDELLNKSLSEFRDAVLADDADAADSVREGLIKIGSEIAEEAGLAKSMGHVAEFAGLLRSVEMMLDRLSREADGKAAPYEVSYGSGDSDGNRAQAAMLHEMLDGWYGLGIRLLEVAVASEAQNELADLGGDDVAQIEADVERVRAAIGLASTQADDIEAEGDPEADIEVEKSHRTNRLRKAAPPFQKKEGEEEMAEGEEAPDAGAAEVAGEEEAPEADDNAPLDPLDTLRRLLAAALVTVDAISNSGDEGDEEMAEEDPEEGAEEMGEPEGEEEAAADEGGEADPEMADEPAEDEEAEEAEEEVKRAEKAVRTGRLRKSHTPAELDKARRENAELQKSLAKAQADLQALQSKPGMTKAHVSTVALSKEADSGGGAVDSEVERLSKMAPEQRALEVFKAALRNPIT